MTQSWFSVCQKGVFGPYFPHQMAWWVLGCSVGSVTPSAHCLGGRALPSRGVMDLAWWCSGVNRAKADPFGQKRLVFGPSLRFRKAIEPSFKGQGYEANSYLTCHPNFNKVLVSLLYQLAVFPFQGWDLTRSSVGLYNSRMPLVERKSSSLGAAWPEDCGLEEMVAVLQG